MEAIPIGTVLSVSKSLFGVLTSRELESYCSIVCGASSALKNLKAEVRAAESFLRDAETQEQDEAAQQCIEKLKYAIYDADDLFDTFNTLIRQHKLNRDCIVKRVCRFFSSHNHLWVAYKIYDGVEKTQKEFDAIQKRNYKSIPPAKIERFDLRRAQTPAQMIEGDIIGRNEEVNEIVEKHLLNNNNNTQAASASFMSILAVGGMGKTALAQLVYKDRRIEEQFDDMIWVCVSDYDQVHRPLVELVSDKISQKKGKWLLLVLDDLWDENRETMSRLENLLKGHVAAERIWVLVTTRSSIAANNFKNGVVYPLGGMSETDSWHLLKNIACVSDQSNPSEASVQKYRKEILMNCAYAPVVIRAVASALYAEDLSVWSLFADKGMEHLRREDSSKINHMLMLSYRRLEHELKICFTYCAIFPRGYVLKKESLLSYWIAQGYITPLYEGQTVEDAAEQYFLALWKRCFFHDVVTDLSGKITTFKIHDVMHYFAKNIAGKEICLTEYPSPEMDSKTRHLAYSSPEFQQHQFTETAIRSYCYVGFSVNNNPLMEQSYLETLFRNWTRLRALDFYHVNIMCLPESVGGMLHLRYLNLLNNKQLHVLPQSITKLWNLQILRIGGSLELNELPKDFINLVNLSLLEISECGITYVPCVGAFPQLNTLIIKGVEGLEYLIASTTTSDGRTFLECPSLEKLILFQLTKMKGWKNSQILGEASGSSSNSITPLLSLPKLKSLEISECPEMVGDLQCPRLEYLGLESANQGLHVRNVVNGMNNILTSIYTDNMGMLTTMSDLSFQHLAKLHIDGDEQITSLEQASRVFSVCSATLVSLCIRRCPNLSNVVPRQLNALTALKTLHFESCNMLVFTDEPQIRSRFYFYDTLCYLKLYHLQQLKQLPNWVDDFKVLKTVEIKSCANLNLTTIPNWVKLV